MASVRLGREDVSKIRVKVYKKEKGRILRMKESRYKKKRKKRSELFRKLRKQEIPGFAGWDNVSFASVMSFSFTGYCCQRIDFY